MIAAGGVDGIGGGSKSPSEGRFPCALREVEAVTGEAFGVNLLNRFGGAEERQCRIEGDPFPVAGNHLSR